VFVCAFGGKDVGWWMMQLSILDASCVIRDDACTTFLTN
jgi:hypothetical protein